MVISIHHTAQNMCPNMPLLTSLEKLCGSPFKKIGLTKVKSPFVSASAHF